MTLAEIFREEGKQEGMQEAKEVLARSTIQLITNVVAPLSDDLKQKIKQQDIKTFETLTDNINEWKNVEEIKQHLK